MKSHRRTGETVTDHKVPEHVFKRTCIFGFVAFRKHSQTHENRNRWRRGSQGMNRNSTVSRLEFQHADQVYRAA